MRVLTYRVACDQLQDVMDRVVDDHEEVIVTREQGEPVVMVSLEAWNAIQETLHLLSTPNNSRVLRESITELDAGHGSERTLLEP